MMSLCTFDACIISMVVHLWAGHLSSEVDWAQARRSGLKKVCQWEGHFCQMLVLLIELLWEVRENKHLEGVGCWKSSQPKCRQGWPHS